MKIERCRAADEPAAILFPSAPPWRSRKTAKRRGPSSFGRVVLCALLSAFELFYAPNVGSQEHLERLSDIPARTQIAAEQLVRTQLPSGVFPYDIDFVTGAAEDMNDMSGLNIVRQAEALFALVQYLGASDSPRMRESIARVLRAFAGRSLQIGKGETQSVLENMRVYNRWQLWDLLRRPLDYVGLLYVAKGEGTLISANGSYERAWPGATALALISELNYRALTADESFADARRGWLRGLLALRVPGRGFREAPHYLGEAGYVNGEAWLALAEYAGAFPDDHEIVGTLSELDDYLTLSYTARPTLQFYHWGVMAAAVRAQTTGDPRFLKFIRDQTEWVLAKQEGLLADHDNTCAPLEGLATAFRVLWRNQDENDPLKDRTGRWIQVMTAHNMGLQILPGQDTILLANGVAVSSPWLPMYEGAFRTSSDDAKMKVDGTGHCLSALLREQKAGLAWHE